MIETQHQDGIFRIHFNRPDKLNSFTAEMLGQIASALDEAKSAIGPMRRGPRFNAEARASSMGNRRMKR